MSGRARPTLIGLAVGRPALALVAIVLLAGGMLLIRGPTFPHTPIVPTKEAKRCVKRALARHFYNQLKELQPAALTT